MPSDTLYALSAPAHDAAAIQRVFAIKGREEGKALPLFVRDVEMAESLALLSPAARKLAARFWPGQLTLVLRPLAGFDSEAMAGGETIALRAPNSDVALAVLAGAGQPLTATSANLSGGPNPASAEEVRRQIGDRLDLVLDGGETPVGVPSTVVDCSGDAVRILRAGALSESQITEALRD